MLEIDIEGTKTIFAHATYLGNIIVFFSRGTGARKRGCRRRIVLNKAMVFSLDATLDSEAVDRMMTAHFSRNVLKTSETLSPTSSVTFGGGARLSGLRALIVSSIASGPSASLKAPLLSEGGP